ncbi:MAG: hypothetical protein JXX28_04070 [Deltaproteobacteria bacterium]|nr:hypothetical protein [Deltaproteobacteria bacterium]
MTALLYFIVAVLAAVLATRAWAAEPGELVRQAFLGLGWAVAVAYASFALSLIPGLEVLRPLYVVAFMTIPAFALWTLDRLFPGGRRWHRGVGRLGWATVVAVLLTGAIHLVFFSDTPKNSPPTLLGGVFAYASFALVLWRLWDAHEATRLPVDKARVRYLLVIFGAGVLLTLAEQLGRLSIPLVEPVASGLSSRGVALQGTVPPLSVLVIALALYFLYKTMVLYRLIDLRELLSRIAALMVLAVILVVMNGVTVVWVGTFVDYPLHSTFQIFLGSMAFLALYDLINVHVTGWTDRLINRRGLLLAESLRALHDELPTLMTADALVRALLGRLHASGRVHSTSVYLWDPLQDAFTCAGREGGEEVGTLETVAASPFVQGFQRGERWYLRETLARRRAEDPERGELVALMRAMDAELTVPFMTGSTVLGWLHLRDEEWSEGFSAEELERISGVANLASAVLRNLAEMQKREEGQRLAALGAMAAGLAHEIRNPLAGIKGAAQFLQGGELPEDAAEMLQVVVDETDRLNRVVTQFLDYARPSGHHQQRVALGALIDRVAALIRAQGLPPQVAMTLEVDADLPEVWGDGGRLSQVLLNLVQNALQAMPAGGVLRIGGRGVSHEERGWVELSVSDTGTGIAREVRDQLYTPFFTTKAQGTGLGLAICQRIVLAHQGRLELQSVPGKGSTFTVRLPALLPYEEGAGNATPSSRSRRETGPL